MISDDLTKRQAYAAMFLFLKEVYQRTGSGDLGGLLGDMSLLSDGGTADPAMWADWEDAVRRVQEGKVN